jgi:hypothetical protein
VPTVAKCGPVTDIKSYVQPVRCAWRHCCKNLMLAERICDVIAPWLRVRMARARRSRRPSVAQAASSLARTSRVTALALLWLRFRGTAVQHERPGADLRGGEARAPSRARHFVNVDQFPSRRRTVEGACGPVDLRKRWLRRFSSTSAGMPWSSSLARFRGSHRRCATNLSSSASGAGQGRELPVATNPQASR